MKKIIFLLTLSAFLFAACSDKLDLNPLDQPSSLTFWKTKNDYTQALTSLYGAMQRKIFSVSLCCWDNITDNGFGQYADDNYGMTAPIVTGSINSSSTGFINGVYFGAFADIARTNIFLQNLSSYKGIDIDEVTKKTYEAEARMIRAHYYSYLYRCFGSVPIVDKPVDLTTQYQEKKPANDVLKFIMEDMDFAIANLPKINYIASNGHWNMSAAKAYKARMLLYTAYDDSGNAIAQTMDNVKTLLSDIKGFSLAADYSDNFKDEKQQSCPEIMMSVKFLAPNNYHSLDQWLTSWYVVSPLSNLIMEYEFKNGSPGIKIPVSANGVVDILAFPQDSLTTRDPRLAKTIFIRGFIYNGIYYQGRSCPIGTGLGKFMSGNLQPPYSYGTYTQVDLVLLRYADVLLMLAEAENELNGPTNIAYKAINDIRVRAGMPALPSGLTKDQMRARIRHERRIELAFEGERYFDLKRWKKAKQILNNVTDGLLTYKFEDKHYLWPLPQSEIDINKGILIQNPNY